MINDKVGIYIPTYNRAQFIGKTIESILNQTYSSFTLTIVDNASTDDTERVVNSFQDKRIKYVRNEENIGAIKNINKCFELAIESEYNYIAIYHSDDEYISTIVEKEVEFLRNSNDIKIVFANLLKIDNNGNKIEGNENNLVNDNTILDYKQLLFKNLLTGTPLVCPTFMCKKEILKRNSQFDEKYTYAGDTEYYLRASRNLKIGILYEPLIKYRISELQETQRQYKEKGIREEYIVLNNEINYYQKNFGEIPSEVITPYKRRLALEYLRNSIDLLNDDYKHFSKEISSFAIKSIDSFKYPLTSKVGIKQKILKYRLYQLYLLINRI